MKKIRLEDEEQEFINHIFQSDMYPALPKVLNALLEELVDDLLRYNAQAGTDRDLLYKKAKIDGARELYNKLANYKKSFKFS